METVRNEPRLLPIPSPGVTASARPRYGLTCAVPEFINEEGFT